MLDFQLIDAAQCQRKNGGGFELRWSSGAVSVVLDLKIVSNADAPGGEQRQGVRGIRPPPTIVGTELAWPAAGTLTLTDAGAP